MTVGSRSIRMMAILFVFNSILAAVALFVFYAVPAIYFILLYTEGRKEVRARKVARSVRVRQTKTQQRVQSNLQQRYESPLQKQEPIVYMPNRRTSSPPHGTRRPQTANTSRSSRSRAQSSRSKRRH